MIGVVQLDQSCKGALKISPASFLLADNSPCGKSRNLLNILDERWTVRMNLSINQLKKAVVATVVLTVLALATLFQSSSRAAVLTSGDGADTFKTKCAACHGP